MKKILMMVFLGAFLSGCTSTNPPEPPKAKGNWQTLVTNLNEIQAR